VTEDTDGVGADDDAAGKIALLSTSAACCWSHSPHTKPDCRGEEPISPGVLPGPHHHGPGSRSLSIPGLRCRFDLSEETVGLVIGTGGKEEGIGRPVGRGPTSEFYPPQAVDTDRLLVSPFQLTNVLE